MTPMGSMFIKIAKLRLTKKRGGKGSDVELRRESAYDSNDRSTYRAVCMYYGYDRGKNRKASCTIDMSFPEHMLFSVRGSVVYK